ncbi:hypothetical protein [Pseudomonas sp.]|uniref:hypothetical protein n=1 Tax=Pseudomonas sp. TaxID=306 RepID=UPI00260E05D9|nr:hypothetical protein [Pseudomonas sp.]
MLLNEVELGWDKTLKTLPVSGVLLPVFLAKAEEQVGGKCLVNSCPVILIADCTSFWNRFANYLVKAILPFDPVVNSLLCVAHMSGLPGLFVWKQKAITDVPDTQFTRNTKSRAQKNHRARVVSRAALTAKSWS